MLTARASSLFSPAYFLLLNRKAWLGLRVRMATRSVTWFVACLCGAGAKIDFLVMDPSFVPSGFARNLTGSVAFDSESNELFVAQRLSPHLLVLDATNGSLLRILHEAEPYISRAHFVRLRKAGKTLNTSELWVTDAGGVPDDGRQKGHTVLSFSPLDGSLLRPPIGQPGDPGTALSPLEFGVGP